MIETLSALLFVADSLLSSTLALESQPELQPGFSRKEHPARYGRAA